MNIACVGTEDYYEDRYRGQCDKLREAVGRLNESEARSWRARERLATARAKQEELENEISILE